MKTQIKKANPFGAIGETLSKSGGLDELLSKSNRFDIRIDQIKTFGQVRTDFNENELQELANSIKSRGVLQNIIVNEKIDDNGIAVYHLIAGERRLRAAKIANLEVLPALVLEVSDEEALQIQLIENIQRENLTAIDLANALESELAELKGDYEALGKKYNKSRSWLSKAMQMNKVEGKAQEVMTVSSDVEVILGIQQLEKTNPAKAEALVEQIKGDIGKKNIRKTVKAELKNEKDNLKEKKTGAKSPAKTETQSPAAPKPAFAGLACLAPEPVKSKEPEEQVSGDAAPFPTESFETTAAKKTEAQDVIIFGDAIDIFCFDGNEVPDNVYDLVSKQKEEFSTLYEKSSSYEKIYPKFLEVLKAAGFKLDSKNVDLKALIELVILVNSSEKFDIEKITLNIRDTLVTAK